MPEGRRFERGNSGRPKGSRNKFGEAFLAALHNDFAANGAAAIVRARETDPVAYIRVIASLLPREVKLDPLAEMTDDELDGRIRQLQAALLGEC
jgi:hypothetical protein